ncbi:MAG: hypothetical protein IKN17_07485 [Ruminococcus sp.]|nr:hypothetical protein [Ruminococcus sp.]
MKLKRIIAAASAILMLAGTVPGSVLGAFAVNDNADDIEKIGARMWEESCDTDYGYTVADP